MSNTESTHIELIETIDSKGDKVYIRQKSYREALRFENNINCKGLMFEDCNFEYDVSFENIFLPEGIAFIKCNFQGDLYIRDCRNEIIEKLKKPSDNIYLENCVLTNNLNITNVVLNGSILIKYSEIDGLQLSHFASNFGEINLNDSKFIKDFTINDCQINKDFEIFNCKILTQIRISNLRANLFGFFANDFKRDTWIWAGEARNGIAFNEGTYHDDFKIESVKSNLAENGAKPTLTLVGVDFKKHCIVNYADITHKNFGGCPIIYIEACEFGTALIVNENGYGEQISEIEQMTILLSKKILGEIVLNDLSIKDCDISGTNYDASIIFNNIEIQRFNFKYFSNYGKMQFVNIRATTDNHSFLFIKNSFFGNAHFSNVNFLSFTDVLVENSDLSQISTSGMTWFKEENVDSYYNRNRIKGFFARRKENKRLKNKSKVLFEARKKIEKNQEISAVKQKKELYRQLKSACEKQGDRIQSLEFKKYEMKAYKQEIYLTSKWYNYDRFVLFISQSNDYGQNWVKPFLLLLLSSSTFFTLIIIAHTPGFKLFPATSIKEVQETLDILKVNSSKFILLLNPIQEMKDVFKDQPISFTVYTLSLIHKIILSYLIFQTVSAFRKFIK